MEVLHAQDWFTVPALTLVLFFTCYFLEATLLLMQFLIFYNMRYRHIILNLASLILLVSKMFCIHAVFICIDWISKTFNKMVWILPTPLLITFTLHHISRNKVFAHLIRWCLICIFKHVNLFLMTEFLFVHLKTLGSPWTLWTKNEIGGCCKINIQIKRELLLLL